MKKVINLLLMSVIAAAGVTYIIQLWNESISSETFSKLQLTYLILIVVLIAMKVLTTK